jgi:hypothetical protein
MPRSDTAIISAVRLLPFKIFFDPHQCITGVRPRIQLLAFKFTALFFAQYAVNMRPYLRTISPAEPELNNRSVDGETDPERDAEELLRLKVRERRGGEEYAHDRARGGDSQ